MTNTNGLSLNGHGTTDQSTLSSSYYGLDPKEVTRLMIQGLYDLGYMQVAKQLEEDSNCSIEAPQVHAFRTAVLDGNWVDAEKWLLSIELQNSADLPTMQFSLRRQQYLELLEERNITDALQLLRTGLSSLNCRRNELHNLANLLMFSVEEAKSAVKWDGKSGQSRRLLLDSLQNYMSPSIMIPSHRLATLLNQAKTFQIDHCNYWIGERSSANFSLYRDLVDDRSKFPTIMTHVLRDHTNEVWYVDWSPDGRYLASSSLDCQIIVRDSKAGFKQVAVLSGHKAGIVHFAWSPDGRYIASGSQDFKAMIWDVQAGKCIRTLHDHKEYVVACAWTPSGKELLTGSPDGKLILWQVEDGKELCRWTDHLVMNLAVTPDGKKAVIIDNENNMHIYDLTTRELMYSVKIAKTLTSLTISKDSRYALVNVATEEVHLWDLQACRLSRIYVGQVQHEFIIRSCFGGVDENFILSGSQDSCIYVWNRNTGNLIERLSGHDGTVNCVKWNPVHSAMFASAGDDKTVRIWQARSTK